VTVTVTLPEELNVQDRAEVPEPPVKVAGVKVHAELSLAKATLPVNPFIDEIIIVEVAGT
jgi:hypothetical protein